MKRLGITCGGLLLILAHAAHAAVCTAPGDAHSCAGATDPIAECGRLVTEDALDASARLTLCQALVDAGNLDEATVLVTGGMDTCDRQRGLCADYRIVLSNLEEARQKQNREDPNAARRKADAQRAYCLGPIANERGIAACEHLLVSNAKDRAVYVGLAEKLLKIGQPARAVSYLKRGKSALGASADLDDLTRTAESQRQVLVKECLTDRSMTDCDNALLAGAADEYRIQRQRGRLFADSGRLSQAFKAYQSALSLRRNDRETAQAVTALDPARFRANRTALLRTQAQAYRVLGQPDDETRVLEMLAAAGDSGASERLAEIRGPDSVQPGQAATRPLDTVADAANGNSIEGRDTVSSYVADSGPISAVETPATEAAAPAAADTASMHTANGGTHEADAPSGDSATRFRNGLLAGGRSY